MNKRTKRNIVATYKAIYVNITNYSVFIFALSVFIVSTRVFTEELQKLSGILILGYILGGVSLCLFMLTKNWSLISLEECKVK